MLTLKTLVQEYWLDLSFAVDPGHVRLSHFGLWTATAQTAASTTSEPNLKSLKDIYIDNNLICVCTSLKTHPDTQECAHLAQVYSSNSGEVGAWRPTTSSCAIYDDNKNELYLIIDAGGVIPLWYGTVAAEEGKAAEVVVTDDPVAAIHMGVRALVPVAQAEEFTVARLTGHVDWPMEVMSISRDDQEVPSPLPVHDDEAFHLASHVFRMGLTEVQSTFPYAAITEDEDSSGVQAILEIDVSSAPSILTQCLLDSVGIRYEAHLRLPLLGANLATTRRGVGDGELQRWVDSVLLRGLSDEALEHPAMRALAHDRLVLCRQAATAGIPLTLSTEGSGDLGLLGAMERSLSALLCRVAGAQVVYPLATRPVQRAMQAAAVPNPRVDWPLILDALASVGVCEPSQPLSPPTGSSSAAAKAAKAHMQTRPREGMGDARLKYGSLFRAARARATARGEIFVALVSDGYDDFFSNFMCHASMLWSSGEEAEQVQMPLLVVTESHEVARMVRSRGAVAYVHHDQNAFATPGAHAFGSVSYQELMLTRTKMVHCLLLMGFSPVVVDVDTVWRDNPLDAVHRNAAIMRERRPGTTDGSVDVVVTDDGGEVCGCFVYLNNTDRTLKFWGTVLQKHLAIVSEARAHGFLQGFASEQKVLTDLLYGGQYSSALYYLPLPPAEFPSGTQFFNQDLAKKTSTVPPAGDGTEKENSDDSAVVIHNNFILGGNAKRYRFERYNMWRVPRTEDKPLCQHYPLQAFANLFDNTRLDVTLPSITIVEPLHGSTLTTNSMASNPTNNSTDSGLLRVLVSVEALTPLENQHFRLSLSMEPMKHYLFRDFALVDFGLGEAPEPTQAVTVALDNSNLALSVDFFVHSERTYSHATQQARRMMSAADARVTNAPGENVASVDDDAKMTFSIKVLAYNRPDSLVRLLTSLKRADYDGRRVALHVFIDGPREGKDEDADRRRVYATVTKAAGFHWPHGAFEVTARKTNVGLALQWFEAWTPQNGSEAAFIFEDDTEVSPFYFKWSSKAAETYKTAGSMSHDALVKAVRHHIATQGASIPDDPYARTALERYAEEHAGQLSLYGVCLQKQHLLPAHYPRRLKVRNGHRPFVYALIGSWGPLLFPAPWQAFREWWNWTSADAYSRGAFVPITDDLVVNHWYAANPRLWTPWMVRFARETGTGCLYANLPGNLSLVTNYRERGESYAGGGGATAELIREEHVGMPLWSPSGQGYGHRSVGDALWTLPSTAFLTQWQLDVRGRRAGPTSLTHDGHGGANDTDVDRVSALGVDGRNEKQPMHKEQAVDMSGVATAPTSVSVRDVDMDIMAWTKAHSWSKWDTALASASPTLMEAAVELLGPWLHASVDHVLYAGRSPLFPNMLIQRHRAGGFTGSTDMPRHNISLLLPFSATNNDDEHSRKACAAEYHAAARSVGIANDAFLGQGHDDDAGSWSCLSADEVTQQAFELVVVSLDPVDAAAGRGRERAITAALVATRPPHIAVVGPCAGGATDFRLRFPKAATESEIEKHPGRPLRPGHDPTEREGSEINGDGLEAHSSYSLIGDACAEGRQDAGVKLYRRQDTLPEHWSTCRVALAKRMLGGVAVREVVCQIPQDLYV